MHMNLRFAVLLTTLALASPAVAGDPRAGRDLAQRWCADCHAIEGPSVRPGSSAPSFAAVARMPSTTELSLSVFLRSSHADMPNLILTPAQSDDLVAYILSFKGQ